ncbi:CLUMA_CG000099, isoform A, partial [Clunio marinus]
VLSEAQYKESNISQNLEVSYGLFSGRVKQFLLSSSRNNDLGIICDYGLNKCFYSCQQTNENRKAEFVNLLNDEDIGTCPESVNQRSTFKNYNKQVHSDSSRDYDSQSKTSSNFNEEFLNAALWLSTVTFLGLSLAFAIVGGFFAILNIWFNPSLDIFGVLGLYVWNGITLVMCGLTMIIWGSFFIIDVSNNIGITYTLQTKANYSSTGLAKIGYSFWIMFVSIACHIINIGLVYLRSYLIQKEPEQPIITIDKNDSTILVY